jgi:hypothetical protein
VTGTLGAMTKRERQWAHNWVPLTLRAALLKAHGDRERAEELLAAARAGRRARRARRAVFATPHPAHQADLAHRRRLRALSDDEIAGAMAAATDDEVEELVAELERRDRAEAKAARSRDRRARQRADRDAEREAEAHRLIAAGEDEEEAWRRAYGITEEQERRAEAVRQLRGDGHRGRSFDQLARSYHREEVRQNYLAAEAETRGHLLSPAGKRAGVTPRSLFDGPAARAHKYASEELRDFWRANGRLSLEDTKADLLGGRRRTVTAGDAA